MGTDNLVFVEINKDNLEVFKNLAQAYEAEFSNLTHKMPNKLGLFKIDTMPHAPYIGYLAYSHKIPIGFCVANVENEIKDIAEFYIIPSMRCKNLGYQLAVMMFNKYPGPWQVKQIQGAVDATTFWRKIIKKYTNGEYKESIQLDPRWGTVICQQFCQLQSNNK